MKKIIVAFSFLLILFTACKPYTKDPDLIYYNIFDIDVVPDKFNTGPEKNISFNKFTASGNIADNVFLTIRTDTNPNFYSLSGNQNKTMSDYTVIKNYDFSDMNFVIQNSHLYGKNKHIVFENCKFKSFRNDAASAGSSRVYVTFNHCSFCGGVNSSYITLNNCKIGGFTSDAINPLREFYANNLYIYDIFHESLPNEVHIDGIQIYGDQRSRNNEKNGFWYPTVETGEIHFNNVRFEIPSIYYENNKSGVNACVMFQLEFSDVENVSFNKLLVNGGGKWYPLYLDHGKNNERSRSGAWSHKNLSMWNVMVSNNFGNIFYPDFLSDAEVINVEHHDQIFISSVWKDEAGKVHLIVSNDTKSDAVFTVKSNVGTREYSIPHCPSNWALNGQIDMKVNPDESLIDKNGKSYKEYRWDDMPFDIEYIFEGNPDFIVCYQGDKKIRYVSFDGRSHYYSQLK